MKLLDRDMKRSLLAAGAIVFVAGMCALFSFGLFTLSDWLEAQAPDASSAATSDAGAPPSTTDQ